MMRNMLSHLALCLLFLCTVLFSSGCMSTGPGRPFDAGCIASRDRDLHGNERFRMLGPFFESRGAKDGAAFMSIRPILSHIDNPVEKRRRTDLLWPLGMSKHFLGERYSYFFPYYDFDFDTTTPGSRKKHVLFPLLFSGSDKNGDGYFAVFPLGGTIHEFLGREKIMFVLFPLYMRSTVGDVTRTDVLWPFISRSVGEDMSRVKVFPFYGHSTREGEWTKEFIMWPFWTTVKYDYPGSEGSGFILFPIYGYSRSGNTESRMVLPPFFRWSYSDTQTEIYMPFPFVQYAAGEKNRIYLWPVWGKREDAGEKYWFTAWPFIRRHVIDRTDYTYSRFAVFPVYYNESKEKKKTEKDGDETGTFYASWKIWPLMSYKRQDNESQFRMPDLWMFRDKDAVTRNLVPLWTLYSRDKVDGASENEFLWGLLRKRSESDGSGKFSVFPLFSMESSSPVVDEFRWDVLYGLIGYKRDGLKKSYRLLYFLHIDRESNGVE